MRAIRDDDLDAYCDMVGNPTVTRFLGTGRTSNRAEAWMQMASILGHWQLRGYGLWAVESKENGSFLGRVGLYNPEGWPGLEVGWALRECHQGHGYATEAGAAALRFAFERVGAEEVISCIQPGNAASIKVAEKLGETHWRDEPLQGIRVHIYGVDRATWESHTAAT